jgi:hypothetical protein
MLSPIETGRPSFCNFTKVVRMNFLAGTAGLVSALVLCAPTSAQEVPFPQVVNVAGDPACAASANLTAHMICVVNTNGSELSAISEAVTDLEFVPNATFTLDATGFSPGNGTGPISVGQQNPLPLGVNGTVGSSSCASTADSSADVVCAYNTGGTLKAVRFSILANAPNILLQSFGTTAIVGNASCAIGAARGTLGVKVNGILVGPAGPFSAGTEGFPGETICAFRSTNNELMAVAFNPAAPNAVQMQNLGVVATGDPSCVDTNDGTTHVICAFLTAGGLQGVAFDPRPAPLLLNPIHQSLYAGKTFTGNPGCTTPNDHIGQIICAIVSATHTLEGFAFDPRQSYQSTLQSLGTTPVTGTPGCSGFGDGTNRVICAVRSSTNTVDAVKFDPRGNPNFNSGLTNVGQTAAGDDLSCVFLNIHAIQTNCAGVLPSQGELFGIILHPLNPPGLNVLPSQFLFN